MTWPWENLLYDSYLTGVFLNQSKKAGILEWGWCSKPQKPMPELPNSSILSLQEKLNKLKNQCLFLGLSENVDEGEIITPKSGESGKSREIWGLRRASLEWSCWSPKLAETLQWQCSHLIHRIINSQNYLVGSIIYHHLTEEGIESQRC